MALHNHRLVSKSIHAAEGVGLLTTTTNNGQAATPAVSHSASINVVCAVCTHGYWIT